MCNKLERDQHQFVIYLFYIRLLTLCIALLARSVRHATMLSFLLLLLIYNNFTSLSFYILLDGCWYDRIYTFVSVLNVR